MCGWLDEEDDVGDKGPAGRLGGRRGAVHGATVWSVCCTVTASKRQKALLHGLDSVGMPSWMRGEIRIRCCWSRSNKTKAVPLEKIKNRSFGLSENCAHT